ncbi:unnamed protein product [Ectocarpus sp. 12 AP-2014]
MAPHGLAVLLLVASIFVCQAVVTLGFIAPKASVAVGRSAGESFLGETLQQKELGRGQSCMVSSRPDSRGGDGAIMRLGLSGKKTTPNLKATPPMKVALLVEPSPFTHISGYSNRFREMLKFLSKAGDEVEILTTDDKDDRPESHLNFPITTTSGFRFILYNQACATLNVVVYVSRNVLFSSVETSKGGIVGIESSL